MYRAKRYVDDYNPLVTHSGPNFPITDDFPIARIAASTDIQTIRAWLKLELSRNSKYHQVWQYSQNSFGKKKNLLRSSSYLQDEHHIAIIAYTFEVGDLEIYTDFNRRSRELKNEISWKNFPYKSLYCLLTQSVNIQSVPSNNKPPYFRGVRFHYNSNLPNDQLCVDFGQFTSCSASKDVALNFIKMCGGIGTLIVMPYAPMAAFGIKNYSKYPDEEEVLICPWSTFSVQYSKSDGPIHEIVLCAEGPYFEQLPYTVQKSEPLSFFGGFKKMFGA